MHTHDDAIHARQHERHEISLEARIEPHDTHAEQYRLAVPDAQSGLSVTDVSAGGLGLSSGIFVPKRMKVIIHVAAGKDGVANEVIRVRAIVRRCDMVDHKPTYLIGLQFIDASGKDEQHLVETVNALNACDESELPVGVGGTADA
jgi:c-di-GMP-binding flagellar brake protein YcgR